MKTEIETGSLEDEANKAITSLYIEVDANIADDVRQRVGAFVCQLKIQLTEANAAHGKTLLMCDDTIQRQRTALSEIATYDEQPIWGDDRDDAANAMLEIARKGLGQ